MRRLLAALLLIGVAAAGAPVQAHNVAIASRIKRTSLAITGGDKVDKVGGFVRSPRAACIVGRKVVVTWTNEDLEQELYGVGFTDVNGNWEIDDSGPTGERYTFVVRRKVFGPRGHRKFCLADNFHENLN